jgi:hypothetical protein
MRVYVPVTIAMLAQLEADGELAAVGGTAFALTPALREAYAVGGDEELSYAAMAEAARASLRLLAGELDDESVLARRAVLSADVDGARLRPDLDAAVVRLSRPVQRSEVASVHLDLAEAEDAVRTAVAAVDDADLGDHDAEFLLGDVADHELAWYAAQELPFLLELL